jgi:hypothetical protein
MVDRNLLREFDISDDELTAVVVGEGEENDLDRYLGGDGQSFEIGGIVSGKVIEIVGDQVVVDVGYKSEGLVRSTSGRTSRRRSPATPSRSSSKAWRTRPVRSSSPARRPTGCGPGRW